MTENELEVVALDLNTALKILNYQGEVFVRSRPKLPWQKEEEKPSN